MEEVEQYIKQILTFQEKELVNLRTVEKIIPAVVKNF